MESENLNEQIAALEKEVSEKLAALDELEMKRAALSCPFQVGQVIEHDYGDKRRKVRLKVERVGYKNKYGTEHQWACFCCILKVDGTDSTKTAWIFPSKTAWRVYDLW